MANDNATPPGTRVPSTTFISWNVKGLNNITKRNRIFSHLSTFKPHITFLQETHLETLQHDKLKKKWISHVYHSKYNSKARGVAILVSKNVPFTCTNVISDSNGRYIIVSGKIYNTAVILINIYAPNWDDSHFFSKLIELIPDVNNHQLILGGDWNCVLQPSLDRSKIHPNKPNAHPKSAAVIKNFLQTYNLSDPLRTINPLSKQFSFFSSVHHTYSRIDYFLLDNSLIPFVSRCKYHAIVISDHCPVQLDIVFPETCASQRVWRFDTSLLADEVFMTVFTAKIDVFIYLNDTTEVAKSTVWESLKAYLRGEIISYSSYKNKERNKELKQLTERISSVDAQYAVNPSPDLFKQKLLLQSQFNTLSIRDTERLMLRTRQHIYEHGDRAGKLLAHQLRRSISKNVISEIVDESGHILTNHAKINEAFQQYYSNLYTSQCTSDPLDTDSFLDTLDIPSIDQDQLTALENPISELEITQAISTLQSGKAPGPDGFPSEFFKAFSDKLIPLLCAVFSESHFKEALPQTMTQATISVLLKKHKDPRQCGSYRPISLLNVDYKILSKTLALRLERVMSSIVHPDQTGFITNRQSFFNVRRMLNILHSDHSTVTPEVIVSLDAEKAFDRVEMGYLFRILNKFGFGPYFQSWVRTLYSSPVSSVRTNNTTSAYFPLQRGTRQGCPLSPLLFDLAIEPLAIALRANNDFSGIMRDGISHKVSLYADDLVLYISEPENTIPIILGILRSFGTLSGYKLNLDKSLLFPVNQLAIDIDYDHLPFQVESTSFTYLGVQITRTFKALLKNNFDPLMERTKQDLTQWSTLPISLAGRINSVKMTVLPRFLYLFRMIPVFLPKSFFKKLDKIITAFIWNNKLARINKTYLQGSRKIGGLALPNFLHYYWSSNITKLPIWLSTFKSGEGPTWATMELHSSLPISPVSLISSNLPMNTQSCAKNPVVHNTIRIWFQCRRHFDCKQTLTSIPLTSNPLFHPSLIDSAFTFWRRQGILFFRDLFVDNIFVSFDTLVRNFNIPQTHFFRYLQVRNFAKKHFSTFPHLPPDSLLAGCLHLPGNLKGHISRVYNIIQQINPPSLIKRKTAWEEDLSVDIPETTWDKAVRHIYSSSICIRHRLIQFKVFHRLYFTKAHLAKIFHTSDSSCSRCHQSPATMGHMFWSCNSLNTFWTSIFEVYTEICQRTIEPNPYIAIFGVPPEEYKLNKYQSNAIAFSSLLARRLILFRWRATHPPSFVQWVHEVMMALQIEKLRSDLGGSCKRFGKTWSAFISCVEKLTLA